MSMIIIDLIIGLSLGVGLVIVLGKLGAYRCPECEKQKN